MVIRGDEEKLLTRPEPSGGPGAGRVAVTFAVLFEDGDLLALDKPAGLAAHPGTGIEGATVVESPDPISRRLTCRPPSFVPPRHIGWTGTPRA